MFQGIDPLKPIIVTASGRFLDVRDPDPDSILIEDIAKALSKICRWGGHPKHHYSVAQHSILVALLAPSENALEALLHDAAEAYLGDMARPIKMLLPDYQKLEQNLLFEIMSKFKVNDVSYFGDVCHYPGHEEIKKWDDFMLRLEYEELFPKDPNWTPLDRGEIGSQELNYLLRDLQKEQLIVQTEARFLSHFKMFTRNGG